MALLSPKVTCTCKTCQGPITVKDTTVGCSLCGYSMHYQCAVRNMDPFSPSQVGWFRRSYRINTFFHFGHQHIAFCPACYQLLSRQFLPQMANRLELTARYDELAQLYEDFGLLAEAGAVRNRKNKQVVKNINVDVNDLVNQMRSGTLSIP